MALLNILQFPDQRLKTKAAPVAAVTNEIKEIANNMLETLDESQGVGLAATQVNIHQRIIVMNVSPNRDSPLVLINPEIIEKVGETTSEEGCLSFPGVYAKVKRYKKVTVEYLDLENKKHTISGEDNLLSACLQHEIDHINGITFFDHLSPLKRTMLTKKLAKQREKTL